MLSEGPLPDFLERKELLNLIHEKLKNAGYVRTGFECYSLPDSPMTKAFENGQTHYGAAGHQTGGRVNFVAVGSSSMSNLGNDYYMQNLYDINSYKKVLDKGELPCFRGLMLNEDDKIRQHATQQIRSYFELDFKNFENQFGIEFKNYFKKELLNLKSMEEDGLLKIYNDRVVLTDIGKDFVQNIMNVFDIYDPPSKDYSARLETIKKTKEEQSKLLNSNS